MSSIKVDDLKDGIPLYGIDTLTYSSTINLKKFYNQLASTFTATGCKDALDIGYYVKEGQMIGEKGEESNRSHNMFERKFYLNDLGGGAKEIELAWEAKKNTDISEGGYVIFKLDMVCRRITDQEILNGNQKEILQQGNWEFRNKITYYNPLLAKKCLKYAKFISFMGKNSPEIILNVFFKELLKKDLDFAINDIAPIMTNVIEENFK